MHNSIIDTSHHQGVTQKLDDSLALELRSLNFHISHALIACQHCPWDVPGGLALQKKFSHHFWIG